MTKQMSLTQGKFALVDDDVFEWASKFKWYAHRMGRCFYAGRKIGKYPHQKSSLLHREIMNAPDGVTVDHISGDGLDNRRENMRLASRIENNRNRRLNANSTSGFKGAYWHKASGKWTAQISIRGKRIHLGLFATPEQAALAYDEAAIKHFGEFAKANF